MKVIGIRTALLAILILTLLNVSLAQAPPPKRKKLKDFGSSLKRLKWNPQKNTGVEAGAGGEQSVEVDEGDVIRIETSLVPCDLLVLDERGNNVANLTASDFSIAEDGEPQSVGHFLKGDNTNVPRTIVLIIDYSGSQLPFIRNSVQAAKVLVDKLGPKDQMAIVTDDVKLLIDFTNDKVKLKEKLEWLLEQTTPGRGSNRNQIRLGRSRQYSALMATLNEAFSSEDVRPIVIFQTDGDEAFFLRNPIIEVTLPPDFEGEQLKHAQQTLARRQKDIREQVREFSLDDLYRTVERSRATVYTVVPGIKHLGLTPEELVSKVRLARQKRREQFLASLPPEMREKVKPELDREANSFAYEKWLASYIFKLQSALNEVGTLTGGWTEFLEDPEQADAIYARIFSDINQRYIVGYYPSNKERDGKRRKIDFEVKGHPEYQIFGRRSYFAPKP